jgi:hypothetical protein
MFQEVKKNIVNISKTKNIENIFHQKKKIKKSRFFILRLLISYTNCIH